MSVNYEEGNQALLRAGINPEEWKNKSRPAQIGLINQLKDEVKKKEHKLNISEAELKEMEAFYEHIKKVPHAVSCPKMPERWRKMALPGAPEEPGDALTNELMTIISGKQPPIFTVSPELQRLIQEAEFDPSFPCNYIRSPMQGPVYFYTPYSSIKNNDGDSMQGFYVLAKPNKTELYFVFGLDISWNISVPQEDFSISTSALNCGPDQTHTELDYAAFSFAAMLLFYCSSANYRTESHPNYSELLQRAAAKKNPSKRKSLQKAAEKKYDYILISPAITSAAKSRGDGEKSPHFRRGHFRIQKWGPRWSMEKMVFIEPCFVGGGGKIKDYVIA